MMFSKIRERLGRITPGEWEASRDHEDNGNIFWIAAPNQSSSNESCVAKIPHQDFKQGWEDAEFIANCPTDVKLLLEALDVAVEALEMGAFHHNGCPWLDGKECCCAHSKVDKALDKIRSMRE